MTQPTKKQLAIDFITNTYRNTGVFPSVAEVSAASGSTPTTCAALAATMRTVLGAPRAASTGGGNRGRNSLYGDVVAAAIAGNLHNVPAAKSTVTQHLNAALKKGELVRVTSYAPALPRAAE
jgi:hypothetical protein